MKISTHDLIGRVQDLETLAKSQAVASTVAEADRAAIGERRSSAEGVLAARERIDLLLDPGSPFFEIGRLAGHGLDENAPPGAALITGIGLVRGRACMVFANDPAVKGGTYYPVTVRKHLRAQEIARDYALACVYLVDSGGLFLPKIDVISNTFGGIFVNIAQMSAARIPQLAAVFGPCTAGSAYIPAMCDESIMVAGRSAVYLGGPQLVEAATGIRVDSQALGGSVLHTEVTAVVDHRVDSDGAAIEKLRELIGRTEDPMPVTPPPYPPQDPAFPQSDLAALIPANPREKIRGRDVLARLLDASEFAEYRENFGVTMICGTGRIGGYPVGIIMNDDVIFPDAALKAANFIEICCQRDLPILFLHNATGFMVGPEYEAAGIAKHGAKLVAAVSCATVPKIALIIGGSFGAANLAMSGRSMGRHLMAMWPTARSVGVGGREAAEVMAILKRDRYRKQGRELDAAEAEAIKRPIIDALTRHEHSLVNAGRLSVDTIVDPERTRLWLSLALALSYRRVQPPATSFGVLRL